MKRLLMISGVLSWFNLIVWGFMVVMGLITVLMNTEFIVQVFVLSSIPLHSYASLKLRRSVKNPALPLGHQTPIGIRLMGAFTLFIGIMLVSLGIAVIQNIGIVIKSLQDTKASFPRFAATNIDPKALSWGMGIFFIVTGLCCAGNAIVTFRMLRWYLFIRNSESDRNNELNRNNEQDQAK